MTARMDVTELVKWSKDTGTKFYIKLTDPFSPKEK